MNLYSASRYPLSQWACSGGAPPFGEVRAISLVRGYLKYGVPAVDELGLPADVLLEDSLHEEGVLEFCLLVLRVAEQLVGLADVHEAVLQGVHDHHVERQPLEAVAEARRVQAPVQNRDSSVELDRVQLQAGNGGRGRGEGIVSDL